MSELSIFIDESGDFGEVKERPAYYLVTMLFHFFGNSGWVFLQGNRHLTKTNAFCK